MLSYKLESFMSTSDWTGYLLEVIDWSASWLYLRTTLVMPPLEMPYLFFVGIKKPITNLISHHQSCMDIHYVQQQG